MKRKVEFAPYYLSAVFFYIIGASLHGLKDSGLMPSNFVTENGILLGSLLEILIFSVGIAVHIQKIQKQADSLKLDLEKSKFLSEVASQISHDIQRHFANAGVKLSFPATVDMMLLTFA